MLFPDVNSRFNVRSLAFVPTFGPGDTTKEKNDKNSNSSTIMNG